MANRFSSTVRESADLLETGLRLVDGMLRGVRAPLQPADGPPQVAIDGAGPRSVDGAVAELANRVTRLLVMTAADDLPAAWGEVLSHARVSFAHVQEPEGRFARGTDTALSVLALAVQQGLRALPSYYNASDGAFVSFAADAVEVLDDAHIYATLQYREAMAQYRERLERTPGDASARLALARTLIKCGLYDEAVRELRVAQADPAFRARALHEMAVASLRAGRFQDTLRYAADSLQVNPDNERGKLLLWLGAEKTGGYPAEIPAEHRMQVRSGRQPTSLRLEDVAIKIGLDKTSGGRGTAVFDYDGDGYLDVLISAAHGGCTLYHNNGDGTFSNVSIPSGFDGCQTSFVVTVGDYDNDGFPDVFVTRNGFFGGECSLYHNNGDGTFTEVTAAAGLGGWGPAFTASFVDYDNDGFLDLFVACNLGSLFEKKTKNRLFHNNGDGTFTDVTDQSGIVTPWPTIGSAWGDFDNDGRPDLFVSNSVGHSQLFRNNGDGTFTDVTREAGLGGYGIGSVCYWIDYDNDGWLDLVQQVWSDAEDVIHTLRHGEGPPDGHPTRIWKNNRDGTFTQRSRELGITGCWGSMSGNAADLTNNGFMDIVLGNGSPRMERVEPLTLLQNDGARLSDVTFSAGLPIVGKSHGVNLADLFGDGRVSIIVASGGAYPGDLMTVGAFTPTERTGHYLNVRLVGTRSNRSAIGARITLHAGGRAQHRLVSGGSQFGCLPFEQHFGLGTEVQSVDALDIWWPSGVRQHVTGPIPANRTISVTEGDERLDDVYANARARTGARLGPGPTA